MNQTKTVEEQIDITNFIYQTNKYVFIFSII